MRKALYLSEAVRAVIVILAALIILAIFPLRIFSRIITETGGGVRMEVSGRVDDAHDLIQDFVAQYDMIDSVDFYVEEAVSGRTISVTLFDDRMVSQFHKYIDMDQFELPGYVHLDLGVPLEVGKEYRLFFMGAYSGYTMGLQNRPEGASPYLTELYVNDTEDTTWHLDVSFNYRQPLDKKTSALLIVITALAALALERLVWFIAKKRGKDKDRIVTVGETLRAVTLPVFAVFVIAFLIMVFPMKKFDDRPFDVFFYALGMILTGVIGFYCFFFRRKTLPENLAAERKPEEGKDIITTVIELAQMVFFAFAIQATCDYMNGLVDIDHTVASRKEVIFLSLFLVLFLVGGHKKNPGSWKGLRLNIFGITGVVFFVLAVLFRGEKMWMVTLALLFAGGILCYLFSARKDRWLPILTGGLMLHFIVSTVYCMLFRYFQAFTSARFSFIFHTVTVTAEYLTMMAAVAFGLLFAAIARMPDGTKFRDLLYGVRLEAAYFGIVCAYMMFTVSRTGIAATGASVLLLSIVAAGKKGGLKRFGLGIAFGICAVILMFPVTFTLQRVVSPVVARPFFFDIEDTIIDLKGKVNWDSRYFINTRRFSDIFIEKITGREAGAFDWPEDKWNYNPDGSWRYLPVGTYYEIPEDWLHNMGISEDELEGFHLVVREDREDEYGAEQGFVMPFRVKDEDKDTTIIDEDSLTDRASNGRLTIWKTYLPNMNLTGHDEMGVMLPNGAISVHAHDVYIQVMYDEGIIAGLVFLIFIVMAVVTATVYGGMHRKDKNPGVYYAPLALTMGFAVAGVSEWNFHLGNMMTIGMLFSWMPLFFKTVKEKKD